MKAIVLVSGGLDSCLAIKAIQNQGIKVIALHFLIPFVKHDQRAVYDCAAREIAKKLGCEFRYKVLAKNYLNMLKKPKHGFGKHFNPCIDCKILMLRQTKKIMKKLGASFVVTGEVLGQRPMSQHKQALQKIERESGLEGLLVRPLSALIFKPTIPQEKGWLKKELLFDIQGRGRKRQIQLARKWGIEDYLWPGGGCLLTDPHFCKRLKDILKHKEYSLDDIELLKVGRHFRIGSHSKLVVGRDQKENEKLNKLAKRGDLVLEPKDLPGPTGIGRGIINERIKKICTQIIARYTQPGKIVKVSYGKVKRNKKETILVKALSESKVKSLMIS